MSPVSSLARGVLAPKSNAAARAGAAERIRVVIILKCQTQGPYLWSKGTTTQSVVFLEAGFEAWKAVGRASRYLVAQFFSII